MERRGALRTVAFSLAVVGSLAFGAAQALAEPGAAELRRDQCYPECADRCQGYPGYPLSNGVCVCCYDG